jgi:FkbM family methyltransferase
MNLGATSFFGKLIREPLRLVPKMKPLPVLSGHLRGMRWLSTAATHGCWLGIYEADLQQQLAAELHEGSVFYDVGANVGFFTLLAARAVGPTGRVFAFEPLPRNVELLQRHIAINHIRNAILFPAAVADAAGAGRISTNNSPSQGSLVADGSGTDVEMVTLDGLLASQAIAPPTVIKIDVEGAESRVLGGARHILSTYLPKIFLSTHGYRQHELCWRFLEELGYVLQLRRDGAADGQYEIVATRPQARS